MIYLLPLFSGKLMKFYNLTHRITLNELCYSCSCFISPIAQMIKNPIFIRIFPK